jgi:hypothetical protein
MFDSDKGNVSIFDIFLVIGVVLLGLMLVGCDKEKFQKDHPVEAEVLEDVVDVGEELVETVVESELHIPHDSLKPVFIHPVFPHAPDAKDLSTVVD